MTARERQVILIGEGGKVLFHSARCLIAETDDGNYEITDLTRKPKDFELDYVEIDEPANSRQVVSVQLPDGTLRTEYIDSLVQDGQYASKGAARRALGIDTGLLQSNVLTDWQAAIKGATAGLSPELPNG